MSVTVKLKGPNKTEATLSTAQAESVKDIIIDMMNREITRKEAEKRIVARCNERGMPLEFTASKIH